jgi:hypothetical protein
MLNKSRLTLAAAILLSSVAIAAAQTTPDPHHPKVPATAASPSGKGMPAKGGMGGAMPMMDMSNMMEMMQMMRGMMMGGDGMGMMPGGGAGMMPFEHVEGRIAFLKTELAITDAQIPQWNAFADAIRASAKGMRERMSNMMQSGMPATAPARADAMLQMMTARLEAMKEMASAGKALYETFTDTQKKVADELMPPRMGMAMEGGTGMGRMQ